MDLQLAGRRALVLGASRGIGYGIARALVREGCHVVIVGRVADRLEKARAALAQQGSGTIACAAADLADESAPAALQSAVESQLGQADILVNNGGGPPPGPIADVARDQWQYQFNAMAGSIFELTSRLLPPMQAQGWGRILTVVSSGVIQPIDKLGISNALRSSIVGWAKTLSNEVGQDGITVNCLAPGRIATQRVASLDQAAAEAEGSDRETVKQRNEAAIRMRRYGDIQEFGDTAAFLASPRGGYITGSTIRIDGGLVKAV